MDFPFVFASSKVGQMDPQNVPANGTTRESMVWGINAGPKGLPHHVIGWAAEHCCVPAFGYQVADKPATPAGHGSAAAEGRALTANWG